MAEQDKKPKRKTKKTYPSYTFNPSIALMQSISVGDENKNSRFKSKQEREDEIRETEALMTNKETGEESDVVIMEKSKLPTKPQFAFISDTLSYDKLFSGFDISKLSSPAICVLQFIRSTIKPKQHVISIYPKDCMEKYQWGSKTNYYNAIANLLENEVLFVKAGVDNQYFLNVNKIYNGDRTIHYRENIMKAQYDKELSESIRLSKEQYAERNKQ